MTQLGKVQELVLRTVVRNGVRLVRTNLDDIDKPIEDAKTTWERGWIGRQWLRENVYERRDGDVTEASNRVSVSRAVHRLVDLELLDAKFLATGIIEDGSMRLDSYGEPDITGSEGLDANSPTYTLVRLSNKGEKLVRSLRTGERNGWEDEIMGDRIW